MTDWSQNERFKTVYPHVLTVEGGYVWDKKDPGGATKFGIAFNYNQGILKTIGITTPTQMKDLTKEQALAIYFRKYWLPSQADELPDIRLALAYFDHCVNAGQGAADQILAKLPSELWHIAGDGPNGNYFWGLTLEYMIRRLWFYSQIRNWGRYGLGWFNRLVHITKVLPKL